MPRFLTCMHRTSTGRREVRLNLDDVVACYEGDLPMEASPGGRESGFVLPTIPAMFLALRTPIPGLLGCDRAYPVIVIADLAEIARVKAILDASPPREAGPMPVPIITIQGREGP